MEPDIIDNPTDLESWKHQAHGLTAPIIDRQGEGISIQDYIEAAHATAVSKGWHDTTRSFGEVCALLHSEISEAFEEHRKGAIGTAVRWEQGKPEGIPIELADLVIRVFDLCGAEGIDLEKAIATKMEYNLSRPYRHGGKIC